MYNIINDEEAAVLAYLSSAVNMSDRLNMKQPDRDEFRRLIHNAKTIVYAHAAKRDDPIFSNDT